MREEPNEAGDMVRQKSKAMLPLTIARKVVKDNCSDLKTSGSVHPDTAVAGSRSENIGANKSSSSGDGVVKSSSPPTGTAAAGTGDDRSVLPRAPPRNEIYMEKHAMETR